MKGIKVRIIVNGNAFQRQFSDDGSARIISYFRKWNTEICVYEKLCETVEIQEHSVPVEPFFLRASVIHEKIVVQDRIREVEQIVERPVSVIR